MNRCFRGHYHDNRKDADECDEQTAEQFEAVAEPEVVEPPVSGDEAKVALAEARRRLEEARQR